MLYDNMVEGIFLERPNRFLAKVLIDKEVKEVHVKNTGRCHEILIKGTKVYLQKSDKEKRKTAYSLIFAYKNEQLINIDSQAPNPVIEEALLRNQIQEIQSISSLHRERPYLNSRFDFYYEKGDEKGFIEVKGVTLENRGIAMFPDAPTIRGKKHLIELIEAVNEGYKATVIFLVQLQGCKAFTTNRTTDPAFSDMVNLSYKKGVTILCYDTMVTKDSIAVNRSIEVVLK